MADTDLSTEPTEGPWERRIQRMRPWLAWAFGLVPVGWVLLRSSGAGAGSRVEVLLVFTPFAAAASLLCIVGAALLRHRVATGLAAAGSVGFVVLLAPLFTPGPNPDADRSASRVNVMTFNARYGEADPGEVVALVAEHDIDVLGVQEITPEMAEDLERLGLHDRLNHRVVHPDSEAAGMALYANEPFEQVDVGVTDEVDPITGRFTFGGGRQVEITVVHPLPPLGSWRSTWTAALGQLAEVEVGGADDPVRLIIGDFNATLDQPSLRSLLDAGYRDAASVVGRGWMPTWGPGAVPLLAIDHVLVDGSVRVDSVRVHQVSGSDHRAVIATVVLSSSTR